MPANMEARIIVSGTNTPLDGYEHRSEDSLEVDIQIAPIGTLTSPSLEWTCKRDISDADGMDAIVKKTSASGGGIAILNSDASRIDAKLTLSPDDMTDLGEDEIYVWDLQLKANGGAFKKTWPKGNVGHIAIKAGVNRS